MSPLFAKKSLGQHFLTSRHVLEQIITAANIQPNETVLEIGPGTGILTEALLKAGARVVAVEKDSRAIGILKEKFFTEINSGALNIIEGDILTLESFPTSLLADSELRGASNLSITSDNFALIANIPYYITGAILEKFLEHGPRPNRMVLLVQREVAERIVARDHKESILSISVKAFGTPSIIARVPRGAFVPPPSVESAILSIDSIINSHFSEEKSDIRQFFQIVRAGFAHKRKYLKRNLESVIEKGHLEDIWRDLNLEEKVRAEDLELAKWVEITKYQR